MADEIIQSPIKIGQEEPEALTHEELIKLKDILPPEEYNQVLYASMPSVWITTFLSDPQIKTQALQLRDYQIDIVDDPNRHKILRLGRQLGKCHIGSSKLHLSSGKQIRLDKTDPKKIYDIISYDVEKNTFVKDKAKVSYNGNKPTVVIKTKTGFTNVTTHEHPFLKVYDNNEVEWVPAKDIKIGDHIIVPKYIPTFDSKENIETKQIIKYANAIIKSLGRKLGKAVDQNLDTAYHELNMHDIKLLLFKVLNVTLIKSIGRETKDGLYLISNTIKTLYEVKKLLLRIGVSVTVTKYNGHSYLYIAPDQNIIRLYNAFYEISFFNTTKLVKGIKELVEIYGLKLDYDYKENTETDVVIRVSNVGSVGDTYAIEVEKNHNMIVDGMLSHNTFLMTMLAIWNAVVFPNSKVIIASPKGSQIINIFNDIREQVSTSTEVKKYSKSFYSGSPRIAYFNNGSTIKCYIITKESSNSGGASIRGDRCNVLFIDEADYIDDDTMEKAIIPTTTSYKYPKIWMSSTPSGRVSVFYKTWNKQNYSKWHLPSSVNPSWTPEKEKDLKSLDRGLREREYYANWYIGESGVFSIEQLREIQNVTSRIIPDIRNATIRQYSYADQDLLLKQAKYKFIGVDWNKRHGTRIVVTAIDKTNKMVIIHKEKISYSDFAQHIAIEKIVHLNKLFNPDIIAVDVGHGDMQIEALRMVSLKDPSSNLSKKVLPVETGGMLDIEDFFTGDIRKTYVKSFMVKQTQRMIEQDLFTLPTEEYMTDKERFEEDADVPIADQMRNYLIKRITYDGREIYECKSDHDLDAVMFTVFAYITKILKLNDLHSTLPMTKSAVLNKSVTEVTAGNYEKIEKETVGHSGLSRNMPKRQFNRRSSIIGSRSIRLSGRTSRPTTWLR